MAEIKLSRTKMVAVVDEADFRMVSSYKWFKHSGGRNCYAISRWKENGVAKHVLLHRLILGLTDTSQLVDHKDGDGLNNRRENLRTCCHAENMRNSRARVSGKSGIRNVRVERNKNGFEWLIACVTKDGKRHRKYFNRLDIGGASAWAEMKTVELHGEFAFRASAS